MSYNISTINEVIGGKLVQFSKDDAIDFLLLDSRRLIFPETSLFFALQGPRRDGGRYIAELYRRGVRNFVVSAGAAAEQMSVMNEANIILVDDTLAALQQLAAWHRMQYSLPVIGITGSNGKTIVKEWLNQLLEDQYHIVRSPKSFNSQIGVPLSVWQIQAVHELAIFEAGISKPGEMSRLERVIRPTIGLFTNIGEAHSEGFASRAEKAAEKLGLFDQAQVLIYCNDQPETVEAIQRWNKTQLFAWGHGDGAAVRIDQVTKDTGWTRVTGVYEGEAFSFSIPFTDEASIENALHCCAVLFYLKIPAGTIQEKLHRLAPIAMRLELKSGINHCSIINDSYSADLSSLSIALDFLSQQQQHERRTVILSDILESGKSDTDLYSEVARALEQKRVDRLIAIGPRIAAAAPAFWQWFSGECIFLGSVEEFRADVHQFHFHDETILIKGARVFEFEEIDKLLTEKIHQTIMEVNLGAMAQNLSAYRQVLQPSTRMMAMVKAFGYGSGSFEIANLLQFHGVDYLGVAYADEGVVLRKGGIRMPIMVMNTEGSSYDSLVEYNLEPVIYSFSLMQSFDYWLKKEGITAFPVHIELETGMNRLGFPVEQLDDLMKALPAAAFKVQSVFSHLAASEDPGQDDFSKRQAETYLSAVGRLQSVLGYPFIRHIANSAGIVRHPEMQLDMVRLGIGLYGIDSAESSRVELQEVSTLKTTIAQIKHLHDGDTIGYNRRGIAAAGTVTATVRIGYADGYNRRLGNGAGKMWINGHLAPTIGIISMDMTMIDITGIPGVREGDEVIVFGKELSVRQLAIWAQTIPYEILTSVSQRVKRVYFEE
ncbi:MAG: bifunctional UDP-N-acetylmuramoyl-tripeptide:D-alanyl-D-alanine ligase/alanine racemase [Bacteroidetes bacterium]|nr:bifunctional UDP-N-acetylmuramoyl-tripeptide:D-alanyl-D-alanine ligase/alanine racemase [Bacteroidota bacterium]